MCYEGPRIVLYDWVTVHVFAIILSPSYYFHHCPLRFLRLIFAQLFMFKKRVIYFLLCVGSAKWGSITLRAQTAGAGN